MKENNNNSIYILAIVVSLILGVTIVGSTIGIVAVKLRSKNTVNQAITAKEEETSVVSKQNEITPTVAETKAVNYSPDSGCDWASLYYEALSVIDGADKKTCALINLNDDDIPELFISSDEDITRSQLFSISENNNRSVFHKFKLNLVFISLAFLNAPVHRHYLLLVNFCIA